MFRQKNLKKLVDASSSECKLPDSDLYIIYSMSNSPYQHWQSDLLDFSVKHSGQEGVLVRLCSLENHLSDRSPSISKLGHTFITPSYAEFGRGLIKFLDKFHKRLTKRKVSNDSQFYCLNKPYGMKLFLDSHPNLRDDAKLLWLDPDMIFVKPWSAPANEVSKGQLLGQYWWGYNELRCRYYGTLGKINSFIPNEKAIMFPFCITVADMKKIVHRFCELSVMIYQESHDWQSEMHALVLSLFEADIKINTIPNFGTCNNWRADLSNDPNAFISHYTQAMKDEAENVVWYKRRYTPSTLSTPWERPPLPEEVQTLTDKRTLKMIHAFIDYQESLNK